LSAESLVLREIVPNHGSLGGSRCSVRGECLFLEAEEIFARFFFITFLNCPCYETPKNAIKKNRTKQPKEGEKKLRKKKAAFFVMSRDGIFSGGKKNRVLELPLLRNAQKTP
jgi:hypothetical protein